MKMNKLWISVATAIILGGGYLFINKKSAPAEIAAEPIKVGVIAPLTGIVADYGEEIHRGVEAAGATGIRFVYEDDKCDPKEAVSAFKKLTDIDKISFIIGPACGSPQEAVAPLLQNGKTIVIVPSAASEDLHATSHGNLYDIQYSLEDEGAFIAEQMTRAGFKKVAIVSYKNAFSQTTATAFKAKYKGKIKELTFTDASTDISSELLKIKNQKYDAVFVADISFFFGKGIEKLKQYAINAPIYAQYTVELPAVRPLTEGVIYSFPSDVTGESAAYALSKEAGQLLGSLTVECHGDVACVKKGLDESGKFNPSGVKIRSLILKRIVNGKPELYIEPENKG